MSQWQRPRHGWGVNEKQLERLHATGFLAPQHALGTSAEEITLFYSSLPSGHVLEKKREHFLSFSLQPGTAIYYGTSGGDANGYVIEVALPTAATALIEGGQAPAAYSGNDGTQWIDPRHIVVGAHHLEWSRFQARAVVDQEVLLAGGRVRPAKIYRVLKEQCDRKYAPWAETGEKLTFL